MSTRFQVLEQTLRNELKHAHRSQSEGKQGRARVCARRAAGWAVGWFVESNALAESHANALQHLRWLADYPPVGAELQEAAIRLTTKLEPDGTLPFDQDPIEDAQAIIQALLGLDLAVED